MITANAMIIENIRITNQSLFIEFIKSFMFFTIFVFHNNIEFIEAVVHTNASTKNPE